MCENEKREAVEVSESVKIVLPVVPMLGVFCNDRFVVCIGVCIGCIYLVRLGKKLGLFIPV